MAAHVTMASPCAFCRGIFFSSLLLGRVEPVRFATLIVTHLSPYFLYSLVHSCASSVHFSTVHWTLQRSFARACDSRGKRMRGGRVDNTSHHARPCLPPFSPCLPPHLLPPTSCRQLPCSMLAIFRGPLSGVSFKALKSCKKSPLLYSFGLISERAFCPGCSGGEGDRWPHPLVPLRNEGLLSPCPALQI